MSAFSAIRYFNQLPLLEKTAVVVTAIGSPVFVYLDYKAGRNIVGVVAESACAAGWAYLFAGLPGLPSRTRQSLINSLTPR